MALTQADISGTGTVTRLGEMRVYKITPDNSWLAAGENLDLTDDFSEIYAAWFGGCTVINGYKIDVIIPADGTDIAATTVKVTAHYSTDAAGAMTAVPDTTDLSSLAELRLVVLGKIADPAS